MNENRFLQDIPTSRPPPPNISNPYAALVVQAKQYPQSQREIQQDWRHSPEILDLLAPVSVRTRWTRVCGNTRARARARVRRVRACVRARACVWEFECVGV